MRILSIITITAGIIFSSFSAFAADITEITVEAPFLRASPARANMGAAFMEINNNGAEGDQLLFVTANISQKVELHTNIREGNVMKMREVSSIPVPAKGMVSLKPGGYHIMFIGLHQPLIEGETVKLTLKFAKAGELEINAPIMAIGAMDGMMHHKSGVTSHY